MTRLDDVETICLKLTDAVHQLAWLLESNAVITADEHAHLYGECGGEAHGCPLCAVRGRRQSGDGANATG